MRVTISVRIDNEGDHSGCGFGQIQFNEDATLTGAGFETVNKVFQAAHTLLETVREEHATARGGGKNV